MDRGPSLGRFGVPKLVVDLSSHGKLVWCCVCGDEVFVCLGRQEERKRILLFWFSRTMRRHPFSRAAEEKGKHLAKASVEPSLT